MQTETAAPKPEPATVITTTIHAPPVPESKSSMLDALFGPKKSTVAIYVHPKDLLTGRRMTAIMVIAQDEDPEVTATRLAGLKPGSYDVIEKNGTEIVSTRTHIVEESAANVAAMSIVPTAHQSGFGDIAGVLKSMMESQAAMQRESAREVREMLQVQQTAALTSQLEMMKELVKVQRQPSEKINDTLLLAILNRQSEDPINMLLKLNQLNREIKADAEPPRGPDLMSGIASALGALAPMMQKAESTAPQTLRTVRVAPSAAVPPAAETRAEAAAGGEGGGAPPAAGGNGSGGDDGEFQALALLLIKMAEKQVPPDQAVGTLALLLSESDMAQLFAACQLKVAVSMLVSKVPQLGTHREWLTRLEAHMADASSKGDGDAGTTGEA